MVSDKSTHKCKVNAVIVTYNPNVTRLKKVLSNLVTQVEKIVIVDNCF